ARHQSFHPGGRVRSRLILLLSLSFAACSGDDMEPTHETPAVGFVRVTAATVGLGLDPDGYTVTMDPDFNAQSQAVTANGTVDFGGIPNGDHTFVIEGVADNCALNGDATQPVTVVGGKIQPL